MSRRVALVTGAAGGLGRAFVARLAVEGRTIVAADREAPPGFDDEVTPLAADLADPAAVRDLAAQAGQVEILVNNAAAMGREELAELTPARWERVQAVNVQAPMLLAQALAPGMRERGFGRIVNVISNQVWRPAGPGFAAYVASKAGLLGLTRALAVELGPHGITVNALAPGLTRTPNAARDFPESFFAGVREQQAVPRSNEPQDIANALAFLTADASGAVTGQALRVDGGVVTL